MAVDLLEIAEKLQDTHETVTRIERTIAETGDPPPSVLLMLKSVLARQEYLENQLARATALKHLDVCRYELFPQTEERPTLNAFTKTLSEFQSLFSLVYDAIVTRTPKQRATLSMESSVNSAFTFAYTFSGSVGIALTMPNERLLLGETELDTAMQRVFEMIKADTPEAIAKHAREVGAAPIRVMYKWASGQIFSGLSSRIEWRREAEIRSDLQIQIPELDRLVRAIEATSEEEVTEITARGQLVGADVSTGSFHMIFAEGDEIRGRMAEGVLAEADTIEIPKVYTARIKKTTTIYYATEKEAVSYYLEALAD